MSIGPGQHLAANRRRTCTVSLNVETMAVVDVGPFRIAYDFFGNTRFQNGHVSKMEILGIYT